MKKRAFVLFLIAAALGNNLLAQKEYSYSLDLTNVVEDRVHVTLVPPTPSSDQIEFQMPKIVPGTYSISDFGRFVTGFEATDESGTPLPVDYIDQNRWLIRNAKSIKKISYWVDDTWDSKGLPRIFEPGGTNIEANTNFVLNPFGFFGYLDGMKEMPFKVTVKKPDGFYGSTALVATKSDDNE
ncbi:MAG: hypothetical protein RLZZ519_3210, partial [Bacteroidota bacterium]